MTLGKRDLDIAKTAQEKLFADRNWDTFDLEFWWNIFVQRLLEDNVTNPLYITIRDAILAAREE